MSRIRRSLVVAGLAVAVALGAALPAWAAFSDTAVVSTRIPTLTVTGPASVTVDDYCYWEATGGYWSNGRYVTTFTQMYRATVSWPASSTPRGVTGYAIVAHPAAGGEAELARTAAGTRSFTTTVPASYLSAYRATVSVRTLTSYGWTGDSPRTPVLSC
ncbi:hypothetical protein [Blastococcus sp. KM273128]|uniref:hypothetical protein n=1 Tax=Blastococcus sp. KM273128 TaxID=2570314 RepID=UPI001F3BBAF0|nr:hypothetical protein [Blastococcus sp. KM273128]